MKASCLQENLNKGLGIVTRFVSSRAQIPVLGSVLLKTEKGRLCLAATNLETGINFWIGAKIEKEGEVTIPARPLLEFVSSLPAEKLDLELSENLLKISSGTSQAAFNGASAQEFPPSPQKKETAAMNLPVADFFAAISAVGMAASQDEGRPVLTGIKWFWEERGLALAATDGYRLAVKKSLKKKEREDAPNWVIPSRALQEVAKITKELKGKEGEEIKIFPSKEESQIIFSLGEVEVAVRQIEGEFPDFAKIIPQSFTTKAILTKEDLLRAVRLSSIFARESANIVKFKILPREGKLAVSANSPQVGENLCEVEAKIEGEEGEIAFNYRYLLDFLTAIEGEEIIFEMSGSLNPGVFKISGDDTYLHLIMPVRVQE